MDRYISPEELKAMEDHNFTEKFMGLFHRAQPVTMMPPEAIRMQKAAEAAQTPDLTLILGVAGVMTNFLEIDDMRHYIDNGAPAFNKSCAVLMQTQGINAQQRRANMANVLRKAYSAPETLYRHEIGLLDSLNRNIHEALGNNYNRVSTDFIEAAARFFMGDDSVVDDDADFVYIGKAATLQGLEELVYSDIGYLLETTPLDAEQIQPTDGFSKVMQSFTKGVLGLKDQNSTKKKT